MGAIVGSASFARARSRQSWRMDPTPSAQLVGRDRELERLKQILSRTARGSTATVFIDGEAGSARPGVTLELHHAYHLCYDVGAVREIETSPTRSFHDRLLADRMKDPEFRAEFKRASREIQAIDAIVNELDSLRATHGLTKAELARQIGKNPASVRRLFTAPANPELRTVVAMADALDADVVIVPRSSRIERRRRTSAVA